MTSEDLEGWEPATLIWLERKSVEAGEAVYEVIYELDSDPDLLRQANVLERHLDSGARRRDPVLVHQQAGETHIRSITAGREA